MTTSAVTRISRTLVPGEPLGRLSLRVDAWPSGLLGVVFLALAGPLSDELGMSAPLLRGLGAFYVLYAAALLVLAARPRVPRALALAVAAGNLGWVALGVVVPLAGIVDLTAAGIVVHVAATALVLDFALLQLHASRRAH